MRGTDWLDTDGVSARPIALFQVVEIQPPRLRKIYGEGPDKILLVSNEPIFALNQFGTAAAGPAATAHTFLKFHDFVPATDIRRSHRSSIQLAGPGSDPVIGQKRGRGSDEDEALPPSSYQKHKDRRSFHPFRALLMLDEDLFQFYVRDAPTVTDSGFLARMRSLVPEQFRARLLAGEPRLLPLLQARFGDSDKAGTFDLTCMRVTGASRFEGLKDVNGIHRAITDFFQFLASLCAADRPTPAAAFWTNLTREFQNRLLDRTLKGFNSWDARFVLDEMVNKALAETCVVLNSSVGADNKPLPVRRIQQAITAAWASLTHEDWRDRYGEFSQRKQQAAMDALTRSARPAQPVRPPRGPTPPPGGSSTVSTPSGGRYGTRGGSTPPRGRPGPPPAPASASASTIPSRICLADWMHVAHRQDECLKGLAGECSYLHLPSYAGLDKAELLAQFTPIIRGNAAKLERVTRWLT